MDRAADNHYPTSALGEIKALGVASVAAPDCVLFLWATVPMLPQAHEVMVAWGFAYKSNFTWAKKRMGTGFWNRNKHELLLIGTRGHVPAPTMGMQAASLIEVPLRATQRSRRSSTRSSDAISQPCPRSNCARAVPSRGRDGTCGGWRRRSRGMSVKRVSLMRE